MPSRRHASPVPTPGVDQRPVLILENKPPLTSRSAHVHAPFYQQRCDKYSNPREPEGQGSTGIDRDSCSWHRRAKLCSVALSIKPARRSSLHPAGAPMISRDRPLHLKLTSNVCASKPM